MRRDGRGGRKDGRAVPEQVSRRRVEPKRSPNNQWEGTNRTCIKYMLVIMVFRFFFFDYLHINRC